MRLGNERVIRFTLYLTMEEQELKICLFVGWKELDWNALLSGTECYRCISLIDND